MPTPDELNTWMLATADGDRVAFAALFRHFAPRVKSFLMRSGTAEGLADDLVQETMAALWRRANHFDPARAQLSTWVFTIARNLRIDHHRRTAGTDDGSGDVWEADQQPADAHLGPDALALAAQRERGVRQALAELPPEQALVLRLSFFDEHSHRKIAQELRIPLGTVKSRIRLAVTQLRRLLEHHEP